MWKSIGRRTHNAVMMRVMKRYRPLRSAEGNRANPHSRKSVSSHSALWSFYVNGFAVFLVFLLLNPGAGHAIYTFFYTETVLVSQERIANVHVVEPTVFQKASSSGASEDTGTEVVLSIPTASGKPVIRRYAGNTISVKYSTRITEAVIVTLTPCTVFARLFVTRRSAPHYIVYLPNKMYRKL